MKELMFFLIPLALVLSYHKKASIASAIVLFIGFVIGHVEMGGMGWLSLLNAVCLLGMIAANRAIGNKWFAAVSIIVYSIVIDVLCFVMGMSLGAANLFEYVWAGIVFNTPKLLITLPIAAGIQIGELMLKRAKPRALLQAN